MLRRPRTRKPDGPAAAAAAALVAIRAIRDSADVFTPVKSAAAAAAIVVEMIQKVKSNKKDCEHLARRTARILQDICAQIREYGGELPAEALEVINDIERVFRDIIAFMVHLEGQRFIQRYSLQDENQSRIAHFARLLDEAVLLFGMNMQLCVYRSFQDMACASRERHQELLDISKERERRLKTWLGGTIVLNLLLTVGPVTGPRPSCSGLWEGRLC